MALSARVSCAALLLASLALLAPPAAAQPAAQRLLVLDQDAHAASDDVAGTLWNVDLAAATDSAPAIEVAADGGAPEFRFVSGVAISPLDGSAYVSDLGLAFGDVADGAIYRYAAGSGRLSVLSAPGTPQLRDPFALTFTGDGRLIVVDWEADPSGFGPDLVGGVGHGGVFEVDLSTGALSLLSDGTDHDVPGLDPSEPAFEDPIGVDWDPVSGLLYVADFSADGDADGFFNGTLFSLDLSTGRVRVVSAYWNFAAPTGVVVRPDGRPLVVDAVEDDSVLFEVDLATPDLTDNVAFVTSGTQYYLLEGATVDARDNIFVVDIGEFDDVGGVFVQPPGVYRADESLRGVDPDFDLNNAVPVVEWVDGLDTLLSPVNIVDVPVPRMTSLAPTALPSPMLVRMDGDSLHPGLDFDFGGAVTASSIDFVPGTPLGTALTMTLTPVGSADCTPALVLRHPFGGETETADAVSLTPVAAAPAFSRFGDANRDAIVDGLDLAILGRAFGSGICQPAVFVNDADFNDDDLIDGLDLTVLMTYFGTRP